MKFTKMQGIGNDYVYVNCFEEKIPDPERTARLISNRHFGIGSDGLVMICPCKEADFEMRMFNADGSEGDMCGNASRCVAKYVYERGMTRKKEITLKTRAGIKVLMVREKDGKVESVRVDMGEPMIESVRRPLFAAGKTWEMTQVNPGNPHAVIFVEDTDGFDVKGTGSLIEMLPVFPKRTNVEFATVRGKNRIRMRVWERGSGETMACGTGACATLAAAVVNGLTDRKAILELNGGELLVEWDEKTNHMFQEGPAAFVFDGEWTE